VSVSRRDVLKAAATTPALIGLGFAAGSLCAPSADGQGAESPGGTSVTTVGPTINASPTPGQPGSGNVLAITSGGQISLDGSVPPQYSITAGVIQLYYTNHTAYQQNSAGLWFGPITTTSPGAQVSSPVPTPTPSETESANGTAVTTVGPTIVASTTPGTAGTGNVFALTSGGQVSLNGTVPAAYSGTANAVELYYTNHTAYWQSSSTTSVATTTYSTMPNTAYGSLPTTTTTGGVGLDYSRYVGTPFCVNNGRLTYTSAAGGNWAAFCTVADLPGNCSRLTTKFVMNGPAGPANPSTAEGVIAMIVGGNNNIACHLIVSQGYTQLQKIIGGTWTSLLLKNFGAPLPLDNTTVHQCDLYISGSTATVYLDGAVMGSATDPDIATYDLNWIEWEVWNNSTTDNIPGFLFTEVGWGGTTGGWFGPMTASSSGASCPSPIPSASGG
jgi:hypothetical protein